MGKNRREELKNEKGIRKLTDSEHKKGSSTGKKDDKSACKSKQIVNEAANKKYKCSSGMPKEEGKSQRKQITLAESQDKQSFLPGQKYKTPDEDCGALAFYKSLYEQNPQSLMARRYCLEYGVLDPSQAKRILKELNHPTKQKR